MKEVSFTRTSQNFRIIKLHSRGTFFGASGTLDFLPVNQEWDQKARNLRKVSISKSLGETREIFKNEVSFSF